MGRVCGNLRSMHHGAVAGARGAGRAVKCVCCLFLDELKIFFRVLHSYCGPVVAPAPARPHVPAPLPPGDGRDGLWPGLWLQLYALKPYGVSR